VQHRLGVCSGTADGGQKDKTGSRDLAQRLTINQGGLQMQAALIISL